ncbi:KaiC [Candidatus Methanoperedenaceae archaeon GB50]|nr:KaiC [Candidatus Methanoperedenaceae archaeon GB50]CAD7780399.1 MAG: KaiC [Candidatus Methanoperedenaceae archaeon GB50]
MADLMSLYQSDVIQEIPEPPPLYSTGITALDRSLGGGVPAGSVIYILADPESMSEIFLYQFTQPRKTYYFTTERRPQYLIQDIASLGFKIDKITFVDIYSEYYMSPQGEMIDNTGNEYVDAKIVELTEEHLKNIQNIEEGESNIIIDSFSFYLSLNLNPGRIKHLLNTIYEITKSLRSLTYLYGLKDTHDRSIEHEILKQCDAIFDISLDKTGDRVQNKLAIPKIRGMVPTTEMIKFKVEDGIQIDTSRDIA